MNWVVSNKPWSLYPLKSAPESIKQEDGCVSGHKTRYDKTFCAETTENKDFIKKYMTQND